MTDKSSIAKLNLLHPAVIPSIKKAVNKLEELKINIRIVQGFRSFAEQDTLYAQGRTAPGPIVTNARGGESYHNYGLAFDFALLLPGGKISWSLTEDLNQDGKADWLQTIEIFGKFGWASGYYWKHRDNPHFEKTFGYTFQQLKVMPKDKSGYVIFPAIVA